MDKMPRQHYLLVTTRHNHDQGEAGVRALSTFKGKAMARKILETLNNWADRQDHYIFIYDGSHPLSRGASEFYLMPQLDLPDEERPHLDRSDEYEKWRYEQAEKLLPTRWSRLNAEERSNAASLLFGLMGHFGNKAMFVVTYRDDVDVPYPICDYASEMAQNLGIPVYSLAAPMEDSDLERFVEICELQINKAVKDQADKDAKAAVEA